MKKERMDTVGIVNYLLNCVKLIDEDIDLHEDICKELNNIYKAKNADYGNSFAESYKEWGIISSVVRMDDKMRRLKQLVKYDAKVKSESIEDTLLDLANYSIMALMELRREGNNND